MSCELAGRTGDELLRRLADRTKLASMSVAELLHVATACARYGMGAAADEREG